jgi:uncharacterized protein
VRGVYVDTSALGRVLLGEPDAPAVVGALARFERLVASRLLRVELRRLALREGLLPEADALLSAIALVPLDEPTAARAETVEPPAVATLDALHLVTALSLARDGVVDAVATYDARLAAACRHHGLEVLAPR